jgi:outer membrane protein OmpA-like peptidoglycan-associated protein/opacity protein-like surface antigen
MMSSVSIGLGVAGLLLAPAGEPPKSASGRPPAATHAAPSGAAAPPGATTAGQDPAKPAGEGQPSSDPADPGSGEPAPGEEGQPGDPAEPSDVVTPESTEGRRYSARGPEPTSAKSEAELEDEEKKDKWIHRHPPQANTWELGVYGGVWFPSRRLELFRPGEPGVTGMIGNQDLKYAAPHVGLRVGYYPLAYLGVEAEGGVLPTKTRLAEARATTWVLRANVVAQLTQWSVTPFLLAGVGLLGMGSPDVSQGGVGSDQDVSLQLGGGVKFQVNRNIQLRLDVRDVISNRYGVGEGLTSSPEVLVTFAWRFGARPKEEKLENEPVPPPAPADDRDRDTVVDEEDFCPDTFGMPPRGCPQVCVDDDDDDRVPNPEDRCKEDPENRNGFEDDDGCPDEIPEELVDISGVMEGIFFDNDRDVIKPNSQPVLDRAVETLQKNPSVRVRIVGHTSSTGGYRHNIDLSQRRAASVKRYLVEHGVAEARLETDGVGPDQPIDTNETPEGQARNRRIEFTIIE